MYHYDGCVVEFVSMNFYIFPIGRHLIISDIFLCLRLDVLLEMIKNINFIYIIDKLSLIYIIYIY